jgi:drug/metabolite transporter (DMT)-like permease
MKPHSEAPGSLTGGSTQLSAPDRITPHLPLLFALAGSILYGMVPSLSVTLYKNGMNAESILFLRYVLGLCVIGPIVFIRHGRSEPITLKFPLKMYLTAVTIGTTYVFLYFEALRHVPSSIAILLFFTYPAVTLVLERLLFKTPIPPLKAIAALLIVAGSGFAMGKFGAFTGSGYGLILACLAPLGYCLYLQIASRELKKMSAWIGALVIYAGLGTGFLGVVLAAGFQPPADAQSWFLLGTIVIFGSAIPTAAFAYSMPQLGPSAYGIVASSELLTVVVIGIVLLGESLGLLQTFGAMLVVSGIALSRLNLRRSPFDGSDLGQ